MSEGANLAELNAAEELKEEINRGLADIEAGNTVDGEQPQGNTEALKPESGGKPQGQEGSEGEEEEYAGDEDLIQQMNPHFAALRSDLKVKGVDFTEMDTLLGSGESLKDEHIAIIAQHTPYKPEEIKAYTDLLAERVKLGKLAEEVEQAETTRQVAELETIAGGSIQELFSYVATNCPEHRLRIWQAALDTNDFDTQRAVLMEMAEVRGGAVKATQQPQEARKNAGANLGLLTQASQPTAMQPQSSGSQPPNGGDTQKSTQTVDPLEGNELRDTKLNVLCQIVRDLRHPQREKALAVLRMKHPDLAPGV